VAASSNSGCSSGSGRIGGSLLLDAHYGLPAAAKAGAPVRPPCRLEASIPSDIQLMQALQANGYSPGGPASSGGAGGGGRGGRGGRQQAGAATAADAAAAAAAGLEAEPVEGAVVRLQAVKLILHTTAAVCRYCQKVG
jgi:hypothetical protein